MITVHEAQKTYLDSVAAIKQSEKSITELQIYVNNAKVKLEQLADMFNDQLKGASK